MVWRAPQEDARAESAERSEAVVRRRFCRAPQGSHWDPTPICLHMDMHMDMACLRVHARHVRDWPKALARDAEKSVLLLVVVR